MGTDKPGFPPPLDASRGEHAESSTCLVGQQVHQAPQLLRDGAGPDHCAGNILIFHNHPPVGGFAHVQVHTQTAKENPSQSLAWSNTSRPGFPYKFIYLNVLSLIHME